MTIPNRKLLLEWIKPSPAPPQELEWAENISASDYEIYYERLNNIVLEAKEVFVRSGVTAMLRAGDMITGLYHPSGDMITSYCGTYLHAVTAQLPIKFTVASWKNEPTVGVKEGDTFYANEATYGGIHNCDQIAFMPIFYDGELIGSSSSACHQAETGACEPGGMPIGAKTKYDEGMRLVPIKVGENYTLREDLVEMMANFVGRSSQAQAIDVRARFTACNRVRVRMQELAKEKGKKFILGLMRKVLIDSEKVARERIRTWNDGTYRAAVFSDHAGLKTRLIRASVALHKDGDHITMDFSGTSPENDSAFQSTAHAVAAHVAVYLYGYAFYDLPVSAGTWAPIDFVVPEGCFLNAGDSAAVSSSPPACGTVLNLCPLVFSKMIFDSEQRFLVAAPNLSGGGDGPPIIGGINQWGFPYGDFLAFMLNTIGHGARSDLDGMNAYGFAWCHPGRAPDAEEAENELPVLILYQKLAKDNCGFGRYRGGAGGELAFATYGSPFQFINQSLGSPGKVFQGQGLFGGYPGGRGRPFIRISNADLQEKMKRGDKDIPSSGVQLIVETSIKGKYSGTTEIPPFMSQEWDVLTAESIGGGGYGDVLERAPEMVIKDLRDGLISDWTAQNIYCVVYDSKTLEVDFEGTIELRQRRRQDRLQRGRKWADFEKEWLQKKPPEDALELFGSWPDGKPLRPIIRM